MVIREWVFVVWAKDESSACHHSRHPPLRPILTGRPVRPAPAVTSRPCFDPENP
jgi:hypothetical protein